VQVSAVAFTVIPAAGSQLSNAGSDAVGFNQQDGADFGKILGVLGTTWVNDSHDVHVMYQSRKVKAANVARVQMILARPPVSHPRRWDCCPYHP
jgi:hypothetical protein